MNSLKSIIVDQGVTISDLKDQLEDQSLLRAEILRAGRENKELEDKLKTAKDDGIREVVESLAEQHGVMCKVYLNNILECADQLGADNGDPT